MAYIHVLSISQFLRLDSIAFISCFTLIPTHGTGTTENSAYKDNIIERNIVQPIGETANYSELVVPTGLDGCYTVLGFLQLFNILHFPCELTVAPWQVI